MQPDQPIAHTLIATACEEAIVAGPLDKVVPRNAGHGLAEPPDLRAAFVGRK